MLLPGMDSIQGVISIQGNIGAGKTTFMREFKKKLLEGKLPGVKVIGVDEPVDEWRVPKYRNGSKSIFELFCEDMKKNSFLFQVNAFNTRQRAVITCMLTANVQPGDKVVLLSERSMISDRLFAENLFRSGMMSEEEWDIYNQFFDTVAGSIVKMEKVMIYIDVSYELCYERMLRRKRFEELTVTKEYLHALELAHEEMLARFEAAGGTVIRVKWVDSEDDSPIRVNIINDTVAKIPVTTCA